MPTALALVGAIVLVAATIAGATLRRRALAVTPGDAKHRPTVYQLAAMVGGERRVVEVAAALLVWSGLFEVREKTKRLVLSGPPSAANEFHPVEIALINAAGFEGAAARSVLDAGIGAAEAVAVDAPGLAVDRATRTRIAAIPGVAGATTALVLGWWLWIQLVTGDPVGWVPVVFGLAFIVAGLALIDPPYATTWGMDIVRERRHELEGSLEIAGLGVTSMPLVEGMSVVALVGRPAMTGSLSGLRNVLR